MCLELSVLLNFHCPFIFSHTGFIGSKSDPADETCGNINRNNIVNRVTIFGIDNILFSFFLIKNLAFLTGYIGRNSLFGNSYFMMRIFTDALRVCLITLLYIMVASCSGACTLWNKRATPIVRNFPVNSFVQIQSQTLWEGCEIDDKTKKEKCQKGVMQAVSSGAFIRHSEVDNSISYVLTAGHSCASTFKKTRMIDGIKVKWSGQRFTLVDYNGFKYEGIVKSIDKRFDMCLMEVKGVYIKLPVLRLAKKAPKRGEIVYNMAAPHGIFSPRMVLTFDGYFTGYSPEGYAMYSIPTKPGSSGSPIFNINNEIVGNIFAGYRSMENIGVASPLVALRVFLKNSLIQAEMEVWRKSNGNKDKTESSMSQTMKRMQKKMNEYFYIKTVDNSGETPAPL